MIKTPVQSLLFAVIGFCLSSGFLHAAEEEAAELPPECEMECMTDYGEVLGTSPSGVKGYSNCNSQCVIFDPNYAADKVYTGIKWQCVEYARRWLLLNHGVVYGDVDVAADIWDKIDYYTNAKTSQQERITVVNHVNGSTSSPQRGDLLIYSRLMFDGTGHVAVVTGYDRKKSVIRVAEQNMLNTRWPADYARELPVVIHDGRYWVLDQYLLGWKRMGES